MGPCAVLGAIFELALFPSLPIIVPVYPFSVLFAAQSDDSISN